MFWLERSVVVVWFGFTQGQDALTGKQTCHSRPVSCQQKSETVLLIQCITGFHTWRNVYLYIYTQLLGGHLGC